MLQSGDLVNPVVLISDLGRCSGLGKAEDPLGTPGYIPPETWASGKWSPRGDIFSFGVVCLQMLADLIPNERFGRRGIFTEGCMTLQDVVAATAHRPAPLHLVSPQVRMWLTHCVAKQMSARFSARQVQDTPWMKGLQTSAPASWSKTGHTFLAPSAVPATAVLAPTGPSLSVSVPAGSGTARTLSPLRMQDKVLYTRPQSPLRTVMRQVSRQVSPLRSRSPQPVMSRASLAGLGMPAVVALPSTDLEGLRPVGISQSPSLPPPPRSHSAAWPPASSYSTLQPNSPYSGARFGASMATQSLAASNTYASPVLSNR